MLLYKKQVRRFYTMGFKIIDEFGDNITNNHKVRITLSPRAYQIMLEDMSFFGINTPATFINTVFRNFRDDALASISIRLEEYRQRLETSFDNLSLSDNSTDKVIDLLISEKKNELLENKKNTLSLQKGTSRVCHLDKQNLEYLLDKCNEEKYYNNRPSLYIRAVVEEYCALPFIEREKAFRKDIYKIVNDACQNKTQLKIKSNIKGTIQTLVIYPYKIVNDSMHTQSYLMGYCHPQGAPKRDKYIASFAMARINPRETNISSFISANDIKVLEDKIAKYSPTYILEDPVKVKAKLSERGKSKYQRVLISRPELVDGPDENGIYTFACTELQAFNYFFNFGADVEIVEPESLRNRFSDMYSIAAKIYI